MPRRAALVLASLVALGCAPASDDGGSAAASRDSTAAAPRDTAAAPGAAAPGATAADTAARRTDDLTGTGGVVPPESVAVAAPEDSDDVVPSAGELAALHAELAMPLAGVDPTKLPDTFEEARGEGRVHHALDIPAPRGTPVLSAAPGRVLKLFTSEAGGLMVYAADSSDRFVLMYAHLDAYAPGLRDGQPLARGQPVGVVGTTGNAPPNLPHLHFAIARPRTVVRWWTGTAVDPRPLLQPRAP
jgi:murein DD-endopeptidase MepM/ murein hydrolase activator NlpD